MTLPRDNDIQKVITQGIYFQPIPWVDAIISKSGMRYGKSEYKYDYVIRAAGTNITFTAETSGVPDILACTGRSDLVLST